MAKSLQEVLQGLNKEEVDVDYETIPDEMGAFREAPQPGSYRFRCPASLDNCFDTVDVKVRDDEGNVIQVKGDDGKTKDKTQQRINVIFEGNDELLILQSPKGAYDGESLRYRISNIERRRFVSKGVFTKVSDLTYLLRAVAPEQQPRTNEQFIQAALQALPNAEFGADVEWQGFCNPTRDAYFAFEGENGEIVYEVAQEEGSDDNRPGCGKRVYHRDWPKDEENPGQYAERMQCECSAWLRPFVQLSRFKA